MAIETTAFGIDFMIRPQTPLQALSTSLEVGKMVTIQIANDKMQIFCHRKHVYYTSGEILFLSTDHLGQHEVACLYQSWWNQLVCFLSSLFSLLQSHLNPSLKLTFHHLSFGTTHGNPQFQTSSCRAFVWSFLSHVLGAWRNFLPVLPLWWPRTTWQHEFLSWHLVRYLQSFTFLHGLCMDFISSHCIIPFTSFMFILRCLLRIT